MRVVIVIPTYNEKDNVPPLIARLQEEFSLLSDHDWHILIVDDHSPDGTGEAARQLMGTNDNIHLLEGDKEGLGAAYARGFRYAIDVLDAEVIFEMDADLSHDPKYLGPMIQAIKDGADVALGSRYISGGSIPRNWGFSRKLYSLSGNIVARAVLWVWSIHDFTSGFRASRVAGFMDQIDFSRLLSKQYAYKIHLLYLLHELGAKIEEVPIHFIDRQKGHSKMPSNNILDSLRVVITLRLKQAGQFLKVCVVGAFGFVVQTAVHYFLLRLNFAPYNSNVIGAEVAVLLMFPINNWWSFRNNAVSGGKFFKGLLQFNLVALGSMVIQRLVVQGSYYFFGPGFLTEWVFYVVGVLLGLIWNFTMYKRIIWRA